MSGEVSVGIIESLPFDGIHLLLGNDLAGDKVKVDPILADKPCLIQILQQPDPDLLAQWQKPWKKTKKKVNDRNTDQGEIGILDTFLAKAFENLTRTSKSTNDNDNLNVESNFSKLSLIKKQQNDPKISVPYQKHRIN